MRGEIPLFIIGFFIVLSGPIALILALMLSSRRQQMAREIDQLRQAVDRLERELEGRAPGAASGRKPGAFPPAAEGAATAPPPAPHASPLLSPPPAAPPPIPPLHPIAHPLPHRRSGPPPIIVSPGSLLLPAEARSAEPAAKGPTPPPAAPGAGSGPIGIGPRKSEPVSLEHLIGTRWLNWIGTVTLLVGVGFFLKYAHDHSWIGPVGRVALMSLAGFLAIAGGWRARRSWRREVCDGVISAGFGTLLSTVYYARSLTAPLLSDPDAFVLMALVTAGGIGSALILHSQIVGFLTLLGGYLTPVVLSSGSDRGEALVVYLAILGLGAVASAHRERWRAVNLLAPIATYLLFFGWLVNHHGSKQLPTAIAGSSTFFLIFLAAPVLPVLLGKREGRPEDAGAMVFNSLASFLISAVALGGKENPALALIALGMAAIHAVLWQLLLLRRPGERAIAISLLVLAMASFTIIAPLCFDLWGVPISWTAEGVALTFLGWRLRNAWLGGGGIVALCLAAGHLLAHHDQQTKETLLFLNPPAGTWAFLAAGLLAAASIHGRAARGNGSSGPSPRAVEGHLRASCHLQALGNWSLLLLVHREIQGSLWPRIHSGDAASGIWDWFAISCFPFLFLPGVLQQRRIDRRIHSALAHFAAALAFCYGLALYHEGERSFTPVVNLWFIAGAAIAASFFVSAVFHRGGGLRGEAGSYSAAATTILWVLLSFECYFFFERWGGPGHTGRSWAIASLSVLWALYASALLAAGLRRDAPPLRYGAFALYALTLLKVFILDMADLEAVYRILAFLTLGALLVAGSFGYARFLRQREGGQKN